MISIKNTAMLKVEKAGLLTSVQDTGRKNYRHIGVPVSGSCDQMAASRVNALLENEPSAAVLECTMQGPVLAFTEPTSIAMSGGHMEVEMDGQVLEMEQVHHIGKGSVIRCGHITEGLRTYIGVKGGFRTPLRLGSRSYFYPVTVDPKLRDGDELAYDPIETFTPKLLKMTASQLYAEKELLVFPGPEFDWLSSAQAEVLFGQDFTLSKRHDRMACQLREPLAEHSRNMITSATIPGTVQLTPSGQLIILLRDGQTTGGYPRILQLDDRSQDILAQKVQGDPIRFRMKAD